MEIELFIRNKLETYSSIIDFIDSSENTDIKSFIKNFNNQDIFKNQKETISLLHSLSKIAENHHRLPYFLDKLGKIIQYLIQKIRSDISDFKIYQIFKNNKFILLFLLEQKIIQADEKIITDIMITNDKNDFKYSHYLYSGIKSFINEDQKKMIESEIEPKYDGDITNFEKKCRIGENDSYLCSLIRQDSVEEFIAYINRNNTSLSSRIPPSIFETNLFLMQKTPTLIEYSLFYGSMQIIKYLLFNKVLLTNSMWLYAIHSNNAELIHLFEENVIKPNEYKVFGYKNKQYISYEKIYEESIICHHNSIADYIKDNFLDQVQTIYFESIIINCYNYYFFPKDIEYIGKIISRPKNEHVFYISLLCPLLTQISIPSSATEIGNRAFSRCISLAQITIPSSVKKIGDYAFNECFSLTEITIPSSVISIGDFPFRKCSRLTKMSISTSVTSVGKGTFKGIKTLIITFHWNK